MRRHRGLLHHLILVVSDLGRSAPFYGALFRYLGYEPGERSDRFEDWKRWDLGTPHEISICQAAPDAPAVPHARGAVGHHHHLAFCAADRADVDRCYAEVLVPLARLQPNWTTFVGAAQGVLSAAGLIDSSLDASALMGLSGRAFHLTLDDTCWPGCATMYDWPREHAAAFERIGVLAEVFQARPESPTYDAARRRAVTHIKAALDRGVAVVLWGVDAPEFGVVYGYDDADGVFLVDGVMRLNGGHSTPLLYENVGRSCDVPELHYVVPVERVPWDAAAAHRAALRDYLERTEVRPQLVPRYPSGLRAYDNWLTALEAGTFVPFGLRYNTAVLADAKQHAATYLTRLAADGLARPHLAEAGATADENAALFRRMLEVLGMDGPEGAAHLGQPVAPAQAKALVPLVRAARGLESRQLDLIRRAVAD